MSSTKPANLSTTSKDFPQELLDQLNYVVSDLYAWISELRGLDGFKHDANSSEGYITADDVTFDNLNANGGVGTQSDQVARGDKGVENGSNHDHVGGEGAAITEAAVTLSDNTTLDVSTTKHGLVPKAPADATKFLRGDATWAALPLTVSWTLVSSFLNSWVNFGLTTLEAAYCKDALGFVHLRGSIKSGTMDLAAFTLPSGFRASADSLFPSVQHDGVTPVFGYVTIEPDGDVIPKFGGNSIVTLDGITFYAG